MPRLKKTNVPPKGKAPKKHNKTAVIVKKKISKINKKNGQRFFYSPHQLVNPDDLKENKLSIIPTRFHFKLCEMNSE